MQQSSKSGLIESTLKVVQFSHRQADDGVHSEIEKQLATCPIITLGACIVLGVLWFFAGDRWSLGSDEGYNLSKASLYSLVNMHEAGLWSDQPLFYVAVQSCFLSLFGSSPETARLVSVVFAAGMVASIATILMRISPAITSAICLMFMLSSPMIPEYCVAVNVTVPSISLTLIATVLFLSALDHSSHSKAILSAIVFAMAMHSKLATILVLPAFLVLGCLRVHGQGLFWRKERLSLSLRWLIVATGAFIVLTVVLSWDTQSLIQTHLGAATREAFKDQPGYIALGRALLRDYDLVLFAIVGSIFALRRRTPEFIFPAAWLITELVVRAWHRPFWPFHWLHIAVPMAWLGGLAVGEMISSMKRVKWKEVVRFPFKGAWVVLVFSALVSIFLVELPGKIECNTAFIRHPPDRTAEWNAVKVMKEFEPRTRWVFAEDGLFAFHAGMLVPPEIAVLSTKRLRAGLITQEQLLGILKRYRAEQVVTSRGVFGAGIMAYVQDHYELKYEAGNIKVFVHKDLFKKPKPLPEVS